MLRLNAVSVVTAVGLVWSSATIASQSIVPPPSLGPASNSPALDPLVALSVFASPASNAAVRSLALAQVSAAEQTAVTPCPQGEVPAAPTADQPPGTVNCVVPHAPVPPPAPPTAAFVPLAAIAAAGVAFAGGNGHGHGNLSPISPF